MPKGVYTRTHIVSAETRAKISAARKGKPTTLGRVRPPEERARISASRMGNTSRLVHGHNCRGQMTLTYRTWNCMRSRCCNPNTVGYRRYGARGITVCKRWDSFENFLADMGERTADQSIHRIDNDGNYEPGNCCWMLRGEHSSLHRRKRG